MGLRRMKEHACKCTTAEHVNTLDKGIIREAGSPFKLH